MKKYFSQLVKYKAEFSAGGKFKAETTLRAQTPTKYFLIRQMKSALSLPGQIFNRTIKYLTKK